MTVAMLERNLVRLFENFHHPDRRIRALEVEKVQHHRKMSLVEDDEKEGGKEVETGGRTKVVWYEHPLQIYTAAVATAILALLVVRK